MKNESAQQKLDDLNLAKCSKGNPATIVCSSQHCTNKAFVCNDDECDCRTHHKLCAELTISSIMKIIQAHSFSLEPLAQQIQTLFDNAIDKLSDQRDKILNEIQFQAKYRYLGLTQLETQFVEVVKQGINDDEINCKLVWNLLSQFKGQVEVKETLNEAQKVIQKMKQNINNQSTNHSKDLKMFLQKIRLRVLLKDPFEQSKIMKGSQDQKKLLAFFTEKKVESAKLLYRASQNDFLTTKWYEKCGNISNTLTIIETEFGKVIGGFTKFKWVKNNEYVSAVNDEKNHFLFSLTNNDKFTITKNAQYCIRTYNDGTNGPSFGGSHDLYIGNKANQNNSSYANIGYTYTNAKYVNNDANSQVKFSGGYQFRIKQWEVWQVKFQE